jgi:hypothetical protein
MIAGVESQARSANQDGERKYQDFFFSVAVLAPYVSFAKSLVVQKMVSPSGG